MKSAIIIKFFILLPLILFIDYIIMAVLGCTTCLFGLGDEFYCGPFCIAGKILIALSLAGFLFILRPEIKSILKKLHRHRSQISES